MWPPFLFGAIPTYGVLPYAMIYGAVRNAPFDAPFADVFCSPTSLRNHVTARCSTVDAALALYTATRPEFFCKLAGTRLSGQLQTERVP